MSRKSAFIGTVAEKGYIKGTEFYPEMKFSFIPCLSEERAVIHEQCKSEATSIGLWCEELANRIQGWSFEEEVTVDNLKRLRHQLMARVVGMVIYGDDAGDDPDDSPKKENTEGNYRDSVTRDQEKN